MFTQAILGRDEGESREVREEVTPQERTDEVAAREPTPSSALGNESGKPAFGPRGVRLAGDLPFGAAAAGISRAPAALVPSC